MLNNQALYDAADQLAEVLHLYTARQREESRDSKRGKTNVSQQLEQVLVSNRLTFFTKLTELLREVKSEQPYNEVFDGVVRRVMLMPLDSFPLFIVLARFRYVARQGVGDIDTDTDS